MGTSSLGSPVYVPSSPRSSPDVPPSLSTFHSLTFPSPNHARQSPKPLGSSLYPGVSSESPTLVNSVTISSYFHHQARRPPALRVSPVSPSYAPTIPGFLGESPTGNTNPRTSLGCLPSSPVLTAMAFRYPPGTPRSNHVSLGHRHGLTAALRHCPFTPRCGQTTDQHDVLPCPYLQGLLSITHPVAEENLHPALPHSLGLQLAAVTRLLIDETLLLGNLTMLAVGCPWPCSLRLLPVNVVVVGNDASMTILPSSLQVTAAVWHPCLEVTLGTPQLETPHLYV